MKPYPKYKPSNIPWLGDVPGHWENRKLRTLLSSVNERNRTDLPYPMRTLNEIKADIFALEAETEGLLDEIVGENE